MRPAAALVPLAAIAAVVTGVALVGVSRPLPPQPEPKVRLAVLVVFDQFRGDYLARWGAHFGPNGFARLTRDGAWFTNCHYPYAVTTTGPGHASMLTGTTPSVHGIVNNDWTENGKSVNCTGPKRYRLTAPPPRDPKSKDDGLAPGAPEMLLSETVADVLKREVRGAKVFGLSLKDRSAILPTGQRPDGAFWFTGAFGTSDYYTRTRGVPRWVERFNAARVPDRWVGTPWNRLHPKAQYDELAGPDDAPGEGKGQGQGTTFPHPTGSHAAVTNSPFGNELLLEFAKACVRSERLGADTTPDLLVVSFSSNDSVGHTWGPDSHEVMDVTLRSDAIIAELMEFLDEQVGPGRYLLGLTADHGVCPLPEVARARGEAGALRVDPADLQKELNAHLTALFPATKPADGKPAAWVEGFSGPWVHLRTTVVRASGQPRARVAAEAASFLATRPGVARALTHADLSGPVPETDTVAVMLKRSFYPTRCGDVGVVLHPYCIPSARLGTGTTHGTPHPYDTHVPLVVYGPGIRGGPRAERTTPQALASIFAKWLNVSRPKDAAFPIPLTLDE
ncbi:MAG: alkaline phosphatase family protein [Planctomycetes bacterium]|nr:alkaline phosphatase family protein [Planctomycetota bacterium]